MDAANRPAAGTLAGELLSYSAEKLRQQSLRIESCLALLSPEQIWARGGDNENAVGNLVLHLCGNVRQWIVAGIGGAADVRQRDAEFTARGGVAVAELVERMRTVIADAVAVLDQLTEARLTQRVTIQQYEMSVMAAIIHVLEHFSGHTGQIIFATKLLTGADLGFYRHLRTTAPHQEQTP